ncbi:MAG: TolC family protein [Planctomycetota bacterium]|nr:MAG: TolC family protein [Planctomycetota bacterium]
MRPTEPPPDVRPEQTGESGEALPLDRSQVRPMYTELTAIDLPTVLKVAAADNIDILQARERVKALRGRLESTIGGVFPSLVPTALFEHVDGTVRATEGDLVGVGFNTFQTSIALQWVINPGRVVHEIVAARKRLSASRHAAKAVRMDVLRQAARQYYDLVLAQARVAAAHKGVQEAEELLRISRLRTKTGTGVPADELRAEARLAQRRQELVSELKGFYDASVALAVTLRLDASVTLVPSIDELTPTSLVRDDIGIEELLGMAVAYRPELAEVRDLVEAAVADKDATWWGRFGPQFAAGYQYGGITGHANNVVPPRGIPNNLIVNPLSPTGSFGSSPLTNGLVREGIFRGSRRLEGRHDATFGFSDQQRASAGLTWKLTLAVFGELKTAEATARSVRLSAARRLDEVKAQVVRAEQASKAQRQLVDLARQEVTAADEALRLAQANLKAGTMTTLDVLQAQDAATEARLHYAEAVVRYNQSQVDLLASIGLAGIDTLLPE